MQIRANGVELCTMNIASIVVVNYNGLKHLPALYAALAVQTRRDFEVVFVDNGSNDGSAQAAADLGRALDVSTRIICNAGNLGFAPSCNQGIRTSQTDYVVMLNNDTRPEPTWLENLLTATENDPAVGMVASKMLFAHRPEIINSAGIAMDVAGIAWDWRGGQHDRPNETGLVEVFGPCGGAALYTRAMLDQIGLFDEDFFMYLEDVDLACRARLAGWTCLLQPQARVLHAHSATAGEGSPFKSFQLGRNKVWTLIKNVPEPFLAHHWPEIIGYDLMATVYGFAKRRDNATIRGRLAAFRQLPRFLEKRSVIQGRWRDVDNWQRLISPSEAPWMVSQRYQHLDRQL
jgi:GT2 family glycosyltransferase